MSTVQTTSSAWREPMVWLVVSGPVSVILASMVTVMLCIRYPDPPLATRATDAAPAQAARNHAATGVVPGARR
ncbi:nitrogen fixation protein FixH [Roseateles sp.]|uniref:nitrogen fixation protein FixH n=1 Tax=Roseateles sp. TaxID=1971397 RepID=UPI003266F2C4